MNNEQKSKIQEAMVAKIYRLNLSQNRAAEMMGVSGATVTNIKKGKWANISDAWKKVARWASSSEWQIVETANVRGMRTVCQHAQRQGIAKAISFRQGSGKSEGAKYYANNTKNVFYLECEPHYTRKVFLEKLCRVMGIVLRTSIAAMVDAIVDRLNQLEQPLLIIDEFDQVSDRVMPFFKTFFNKAQSGFVLIGGEYFSKRIFRGVQLSKQSYCETYSRLGAEFLNLHSINSSMIEQICEANGLFDAKQIDNIIKSAKGDLRRVKNDVEKFRLLAQKTAK